MIPLSPHAPSPRAPVQLTLLSGILGADFRLALERQRALGLHFLDLKDGIFGQTIETLSAGQTESAATLIEEFGLQIHCFSTSIGHSTTESSTTEADFRARHEAALEQRDSRRARFEATRDSPAGAASQA